MKLVFFINSLEQSGGTERLTVMLANMFVEKGDNVFIISRQGGDKSFFLLNTRVKHYYIFEQSGINIYAKYPTTLYAYYKLISQINPDYIIDVCVPMSLVSLAVKAFKKVKIISWEHFNANAYFNYYTAWISKRLASRYADSVVVLTDRDKEVYQNKFKAKSVVCIPNPSTIEVKNSANLHSKNVLAIGRLTHQKGFDRLLEAWKIVTTVAPDWALRIVGSGELRDELIKKSLELGIEEWVEFIPATLKVNEYFMDSSLYAMSSRFEGLPLVLIEAKSYGLPIVSFNCETGPAEIVRDGVDGILVEDNNIEMLAEALLSLINDSERMQKYSENALQDSQKYSPDLFLSRWMKLLNTV